jgi:hypothetical protein
MGVLMAVNRYILTSPVTLAAGTAATVVAGEPGTGGAAGFGNASTTGGERVWAEPASGPVTYPKGQLIALDPAGPLFTQIGGGNLALVTPAQETGGFLGTSN